VLLLQLAFIKKKKILLLVVTSIGLLLNIIFFQPEFFRGPFHVQQTLPDLISDLGGHSGMSLFLVLLAFIGVAFTWKKKNYNKWYLFLPVFLLSGPRGVVDGMIVPVVLVPLFMELRRPPIPRPAIETLNVLQ